MSYAGEQAFFSYLNEREAIRLRKEADRLALENFDAPQGPPWTSDPILQAYKFTNVRRQHDRTSDQLRNLIYGPNVGADKKSILMNCALSRYFGTWEFAQAIGWQDYESFDFEGIKKLASQRLKKGERVFTGAYVITNQGISAPKEEVVVDIFLKGLWLAASKVCDIAAETQSWEKVATYMRGLTGFGGTGFMTKEVLLDTTYNLFWADVRETEDGTFTYPVDWWEWTPIGPGALRGAARVLGDWNATPLKEERAGILIGYLCDTQREFFTHDFKLSPTDIQFGLCEFDKYERVRLGQGRPRSRYRP